MNVEELLIDKDIRYLPKGKDFAVRCLSPEHEDRNPSMRIDKISGIFNCFACGFKGNIFQLYGEKANYMQIKRELLKQKIRDKRADSIGLTMPKGFMPYVGNWRDISPETYKKFKAFQHANAPYASRIVFPITDISGRIVGFNGRHTSGGVPKYMISPPGAKLPLFPAVTPIRSTVILVEGIFDMLNLHDKGLTNAVCCFGTKNVNEDKLRILKISGVTKIDIFFDGDEPGQKAAEAIKKLCGDADLVTRNIHIKDRDPGSLTASHIANLSKKLYGKDHA